MNESAARKRPSSETRHAGRRRKGRELLVRAAARYNVLSGLYEELGTLFAPAAADAADELDNLLEQYGDLLDDDDPDFVARVEQRELWILEPAHLDELHLAIQQSLQRRKAPGYSPRHRRRQRPGGSGDVDSSAPGGSTR